MMRYLVLSLLLLFKLSFATAQVKVGSQAPAINITHWIKNVPQVKSLRGKFIVVDFWATWCAPCLESMPHMNNLVNKNKTKTNLVFLAMTDESQDKVDKLLNKVSFASTVVSDVTRQTFDDYSIRYIPYSVMIDDRNVVRWQGNPADLTNDVINAVMDGDPIPASEERKQTTGSEDADKLYATLGRQYSTNFSDPDLKEYFTLTLSLFKKSTSIMSSKSASNYQALVIGDSLANRLSSFFDVAPNQIKLPNELSRSYVSYLYKSERNVNDKDLLNAMLNKLNLSYTLKDSLMDVIELNIADMATFKKHISDMSVARVAHTSESESFVGIDHDKLFKMIRALQNKFQKVVMVKPDDLLNTAISMTVKIDNMANLVESLRTYGILATIVKQKLPVYRFATK